jgi:glycosyltransferase involved in cell wall biosynthesis
MQIVFLTYAFVAEYDNPAAWLKRLNFYTAQLDALAAVAQVKSVHLIDYEGTLTKNKVEYHFVKPKKWDLLFPLKLNSYVMQLKPDVIVIHGLTHPWQVLLLSIKLERKARLFAIHHAERPLRFPKSLIQKVADFFIQGYFFASADLGKMWIEKGQIKSIQKIHEVMEISSLFYPTKPIDELSAIKDNYVWVGSLSSRKDPVTLVKAFALFINEHPQAKLRIVYREGVLRTEVDKFLSQNPIYNEKITLSENVAHNEIHQFYNDATFIISTSRYEGSGTAVCEGMSCGCIPILTNIPSFRMMTRNGSLGLLFEAGDVMGLYNALQKSRMLNLEEQRQKVLFQFKETLSCEAISKKMAEVIAQE